MAGVQTLKTMKLYKNQTVYYGHQPGLVIRMFGNKAVQVLTSFERTDQDFLTHKLTVIKGYRKETWPVANVTLTAPGFTSAPTPAEIMQPEPPKEWHQN